MWRHCPTHGLIKPLLIYILFLTPKRDAFRLRVSLFIERCQETMHAYVSRRLYSQAITKLVNNSKAGKPSFQSHVACVAWRFCRAGRTSSEAAEIRAG